LTFLVAATCAAACSTSKADKPKGSPDVETAGKQAVKVDTPKDSPNVEAGKQAVAIMQAGAKAADDIKDCTELGNKLDTLRTPLWDLGKAHPGLFRQMTDAELKQVHAADAMEALAERLPRCKDNAHAKEFMYAITKLMD